MINPHAVARGFMGGILSTVLSAASTTACEGANLVVNPGFEQIDDKGVAGEWILGNRFSGA